MSNDISHLLHGWPYRGGSSIRKIIGDDGRPKIQLRIEQGCFQGILQMELEGRPDGFLPHGYDYYLDYYKKKCRESFEVHSSQVYQIEPEDCQNLFDESFRIYHRYIFLMELEDYPRVIRDTERNMELFRFVQNYGQREDDRNHLERWWPFILRINAIARVMMAKQDNDINRAMQILKEVKEKILTLEQVKAHEFNVEKNRSLEAIAKLEKELSLNKPLTEVEKLKSELEYNVLIENYEKAAEIRDKLNLKD